MITNGSGRSFEGDTAERNAKTLKGLVAGTMNLGIASVAGAQLPGTGSIVVAGLVRLFGYGVSLVLFIRALCGLGAARTGAYFSTAPFLGALVSIVVLGEPFTVRLAAAGACMGVGVWLHVSEHHEHEHAHEALTHDHLHRHDEHHQHTHARDSERRAARASPRPYPASPHPSALPRSPSSAPAMTVSMSALPGPAVAYDVHGDRRP